MSYSAFFTSGLNLPSLPRTTEYDPFFRPPPPQISPSGGTTSRRSRTRRRSSLSGATSPISPIKTSGVRSTATDAAVRAALRSPREGAAAAMLNATLNSGSRAPKSARYQTLSKEPARPSLPAPNKPLPMLPNAWGEFPTTQSPLSAPVTPSDETYPSSPLTADSPPLPPFYSGSLRANPSRRSSFLLPGRGTLQPSLFAGNVRDDGSRQQPDMGVLLEEKMFFATEWYDDLEDVKENDGDI